MMDARKEMLSKMSDGMREDSKKSIGDSLKSKKLEKVTVVAPDKKGLAKGLSKAEELLKAKFGDKGLSDEDMEDISPICPECKGAGCDVCDEESDEESADLISKLDAEE